MRLVVLLGMAAFTFWKIRTVAGAALLAEAAVVGVLAVVAYR